MARDYDAKRLAELEGVPYAEALRYVREHGEPKPDGSPVRVHKDDLARFGGLMLLVHSGHSMDCVRALGTELAVKGHGRMPDYVDLFPCSCGRVWEAAAMKVRS